MALLTCQNDIKLTSPSISETNEHGEEEDGAHPLLRVGFVDLLTRAGRSGSEVVTWSSWLWQFPRVLR